VYFNARVGSTNLTNVEAGLVAAWSTTHSETKQVKVVSEEQTFSEKLVIVFSTFYENSVCTFVSQGS